MIWTATCINNLVVLRSKCVVLVCLTVPLVLTHKQCKATFNQPFLDFTKSNSDKSHYMEYKRFKHEQ